MTFEEAVAAIRDEVDDLLAAERQVGVQCVESPYDRILATG
jgi:hypothetical protein